MEGEVPRPDALVNGISWRESSRWYECGPALATAQGWKLYLSATVLTIREALERVVPLLAEVGARFKYVRDLDTLRRLNAGSFGYSQIGKCLVVYLETVDRQLIEALKSVLSPLAGSAPSVPFARPFADGLPLAYRFGSFRGTTIDVAGQRAEDRRDDAASAVPKGMEDPLAALAGSPRQDHDLRAFLLRYPAFEAVRQQGKFGIFRALDMDAEAYREVALKLGYVNGQVQADGRDGRDFLRRELRFYHALRARGLGELGPRLIDAYDQSGRIAVVLEWIEGRALLHDLLDGTLLPEHLDRCWSVLRRVHEHGLFLGDAKLANFLLTDARDDDRRVVLLDFETAGIVGSDPPLPIRTFRLHPEPAADLMAFDRLHFLASVLFDYSAGRYEVEDRRVDLEHWLSACPSSPSQRWAVERLREELADGKPG